MGSEQQPKRSINVSLKVKWKLRWFGRVEIHQKHEIILSPNRNYSLFSFVGERFILFMPLSFLYEFIHTAAIIDGKVHV